MISASASAPFVAYAEGGPAGLVGMIGVQVRDDSGNVVIARTTSNITEMVPTLYEWRAPAAPAAGTYQVIWDTGGGTPAYSSEQLVVTPAQVSPVLPPPGPNPVTDIRDLRVLIPPARRAIDGPTAMSSGAVSATLTDGEVLALVADATGELILNTASADGSDLNAFGNQLVVVERDPYYLAPVAWATDQPRSTAQDAAILSQAALNHYFYAVRALKVSETQKNEAVEWSYTISANVVAAWMKYLIDNRDKAIAALQTINVVMDTYVSMVAERDRVAAAWLEPWVSEVGAPVPYAGGGGSGPLEYDYRFNTWG